MMVNEICEKKYNKPLSGCTNEEIYYALLDMTKDLAAKKESEAGKKKVYYISAEFLIGKLLSNNLINLGLYKTVKKELEAAGKDIGEIEEIEPEPSLGNGGLGRLAACFLDSIATLGTTTRLPTASIPQRVWVYPWASCLLSACSSRAC